MSKYDLEAKDGWEGVSVMTIRSVWVASVATDEVGHDTSWFRSSLIERPVRRVTSTKLYVES